MQWGAGANGLAGALCLLWVPVGAVLLNKLAEGVCVCVAEALQYCKERLIRKHSAHRHSLSTKPSVKMKTIVIPSSAHNTLPARETMQT